MPHKRIHFILTYFITAVWLINGLFCKVFNWVPRHGEIVATILGNNHARLWTILIGLAEITMAVWILSGFRHRLNSIVQIAIIAIMNSLEFIMASELLLWGRYNALFALLFILLIYFNEFHFRSKTGQQAQHV